MFPLRKFLISLLPNICLVTIFLPQARFPPKNASMKPVQKSKHVNIKYRIFVSFLKHLFLLLVIHQLLFLKIYFAKKWKVQNLNSVIHFILALFFVIRCQNCVFMPRTWPLLWLFICFTLYTLSNGVPNDCSPSFLCMGIIGSPCRDIFPRFFSPAIHFLCSKPRLTSCGPGAKLGAI